MIDSLSPPSGQTANKANDALTVLIFKDNFAPRTFLIPLRWISHVGMILTALVITSLVSLALALRFYAHGHLPTAVGLAPPAQPQEEARRVSELERQVQTLKVALEAREAAEPDGSGPSPAPLVPAEPDTPVSLVTTPPQLFSGLPSGIRVPASDASPASSVNLDGTHAAWSGRSLHVSFNIQYVGSAPGKQEGRILILARGPSALLAYPAGSLNSAGHATLLDVNKGEHFSVSRVRPVRTSFGPLASREMLRELEILVLGDDGQLLAHQKMDVPSAEAH